MCSSSAWNCIMMRYCLPLTFDAYLNSCSTLSTDVLMPMLLPSGLQHCKNLNLDNVQSCCLPCLSDGHLRTLWFRWPSQSCDHHLQSFLPPIFPILASLLPPIFPILSSLLPPILPILPPILSILSSLLTLSQLPPNFPPLIFPLPRTHTIN